MKQTQLAYIENILRRDGSVTRNQALKEYISRLSSIINILNSKGYVIEGRNKPLSTKSKWGTINDYEYVVKYKPKDEVFIQQ